MTRKSTPGAKANRTQTNANASNKEQANPVTPTNVLDTKTVSAQVVAPALKQEVKSQNEAKLQSEVTPASRKLEVARPESRKNLVPINLNDEIRRRAYELYQQRGSSSGSETEDWLTAESEVRQRYHQRTA